MLQTILLLKMMLIEKFPTAKDYKFQLPTMIKGSNEFKCGKFHNEIDKILLCQISPSI